MCIAYGILTSKSNTSTTCVLNMGDGQLIKRSTRHSCFSVTSWPGIYQTFVTSWPQMWKGSDTCCLSINSTVEQNAVNFTIALHHKQPPTLRSTHTKLMHCNTCWPHICINSRHKMPNNDGSLSAECKRCLCIIEWDQLAFLKLQDT